MENKFQHSISTFAFSLIFPFQPSINNQTINLQNTTLQIRRTTLWIQWLYLGMLKVKLVHISSSVWLAMILIGALPIEYSALRAAARREGQSNIVNLWWHNKSHQVVKYLKSCHNGLGLLNSWICQSLCGYFSNWLLCLFLLYSTIKIKKTL